LNFRHHLSSMFLNIFAADSQSTLPRNGSI
jgi:hypothetical protein